MNLQNQIDYLQGLGLGDMFDNCSVPAGLDMQRVRGAIVMRCGLLWPLFSQPETQREATQQFFYENQWNFEHIVKVIRAEYSPIENVFEERNTAATGTDTDTLTITKGTVDTTINEISAENASAYQPDRKITDQTIGTDTHVTQKQGDRGENMARHGNVGVTTSQFLIESELNLLKRFNPYRFIADLYEKELTLGIY